MSNTSGSNSGDLSLAAGSQNYLAISGQTITANAVDLSGTNVVNTLPVSKGGTGAITAQAAMNTLAGGVNAGQYLRGDGTNVTLLGIQASDLPSLTSSYIANGSTLQSPADFK